MHNYMKGSFSKHHKVSSHNVTQFHHHFLSGKYSQVRRVVKCTPNSSPQGDIDGNAYSLI